MGFGSETRVGVIGVGHFGAALVRGLARSGLAPDEIVLAPRGREVRPLAAELGVAVAADNAEVVARSNVIFLCVRPPQAVEAVEGLPWRGSHVLISACAGVPIVDLAVATDGVPTIVRAMPMTSAAIGASPTVVYPTHERANQALARFGHVLALQDEDAFEIATAVAVAYTLCHDLVSRTADWAEAAGLNRETARRLAAGHFESAATMMAGAKDGPREKLIETLVTKGGVAEAAYGVLRAGQFGETWEAALAAALERVRRLRP
ncbi:MAG: NAD(P)-binding domain-containing protein [Alphaproteobacteria bacterium]